MHRGMFKINYLGNIVHGYSVVRTLFAVDIFFKKKIHYVLSKITLGQTISQI